MNILLYTTEYTTLVKVKDVRGVWVWERERERERERHA